MKFDTNSQENHLHITNMIEETFKLVKEAYDMRNVAKNTDKLSTSSINGSRLVFPKNRDENTRVSEQELRFAFVEVFNLYVRKNNLDWFYSFEEPTRDDYDGTGKSERHALFDLAILNSKLERIALIEFKANNPNKYCYQKDLRKLANPAESDSETLKYFLQIVENHDKGTQRSIIDKTKFESEFPIIKDDSINIRVYSLSKDEEIINQEIFNI